AMRREGGSEQGGGGRAMGGHESTSTQKMVKWGVCGGLLLSLLALAALVAPVAGATPSHAQRAQRPTSAQAPRTSTAPLAQGNAQLKHSPTGHIDITTDTINHVAHTATFMDGLPQNGVAIALIVRGSCSNVGGVLWRGVPFQADANGKVEDFRVK